LERSGKRKAATPECNEGGPALSIAVSLQGYGLAGQLLHFRPLLVPIGALLVSVRDLENARFVERFAQNLQTDR